MADNVLEPGVRHQRKSQRTSAPWYANFRLAKHDRCVSRPDTELHSQYRMAVVLSGRVVHLLSCSFPDYPARHGRFGADRDDRLVRGSGWRHLRRARLSTEGARRSSEGGSAHPLLLHSCEQGDMTLKSFFAWGLIDRMNAVRRGIETCGATLPKQRCLSKKLADEARQAPIQPPKLIRS